MTPTQIAVAVVEQAGQYLIGLRPADVVLGGLWEFPGGKVQPNESPAAAAVRECLEESGLHVTVVGEYPAAQHRYAHGQVEIRFFRCRAGDAERILPDRFRWVPASALVRYDFPAANAALISQLASSAGQSG